MLYFLCFYFGCILGSFLNVVVLRLPKEESLSGRSHCNHCQHELNWLDLFPLFSFIFLGGKCRYCGRRFSVRYFVFEVVAGAFFALAFWLINPAGLIGYLLLAKAWIVISAALVVFMIDLEHFLIFDSVLLSAGLPVLAINLILDYLNKNLSWSIYSLSLGGLFAGGLFAGVFYLLWLFSKGKWIGFGDVKLMLFLGLALGWPNTAAAWLLAYFLGTAFALPLLISGKKQLTSRLPFGCFLSLSAIITLFYGTALVNWYLRLMGF
jgi:prepilin signal peptidase PulO-like enzyme (type II secretory pathway)